MKQVDKFFGLKAGEVQVCNGFQFQCTKVDKELAKKLDSAPCIFGILTSPSGEVVEYIEKHTFASRLNKLAGVSSNVTLPAKVEHSTVKGEHKVVAVSDNKLARQHRAVMHALATINKVLGYQDSANNLIQSAWFDYSTEQEEIAKRLRIEAEAKAKAKAEAEAKAKAEAEAKAEAARIEAQRQMIEIASRNAGISIEEAEKNLRALGMIK